MEAINNINIDTASSIGYIIMSYVFFLRPEALKSSVILGTKLLNH